MKKQYESGESIVRSNGRIRESIRCLPRGHFQQIRQMFDKETTSKIGSKKSEHSMTNIDDLIHENEDQHFYTGNICF